MEGGTTDFGLPGPELQTSMLEPELRKSHFQNLVIHEGSNIEIRGAQGDPTRGVLCPKGGNHLLHVQYGNVENLIASCR